MKDDLRLSNVACHPALDGDEAELLCEEIAQALSELVDERPEAAELLRGRTLARIFH